MLKNFFRKIKESMMPPNTGGGRDDKSHDFERAKDVLFSAKNLEQLVSAVKYINNFNKKHKIRETSPEFIYFDKMINVMKIKLRSRKKEVGDDSEDSERMDLRGKIRESLDDMDWIKDTQPVKVDFNFNEKEYWVDVSKIDIEGREKIVDYIKKTVPNFREFGGGELDDTARGLTKGLIIHCGSDETDYEPEENLICYSNSSYEEDYEIDNPYADISKSIYVNGQEILDYLTIIGDEEELEESLEWTDKDVPFDEKDKSFEADPTWSNDEDWAPNPERSYWKQGDSGGSGGGDMNESEENPLKWVKDVKPDPLIASPDVFFRSDDDMYYTLDQLGHDTTNMTEMTMAELAINYGYRWSEEHEGWYHRDEVSDFRNLNESEDLNWIKNIPETVPSINERTKIDLKDFLMDFMEDGSYGLLKALYDTEQYEPTDEYYDLYTPPTWRQEGEDNWLEGDWKEHGKWIEDPWVGNYEVLEELEMGCDSWEFIDRKTDDYNLEYGSWDDLYIFKRKRDGRYFALNTSGNYQDGLENHWDILYEVFPQMKLVYESEGEWDWAKEIPGTKEYGEKYRYFEVVACYGFDYETEECDDEYSHFVKIPKHEADEVWGGWIGYFGGPYDGGMGVIEYVIENQLISRHELEEIVAFEGVREISEEDMEEADEMDIEFVDEEENINESDWEWTKEIPGTEDFGQEYKYFEIIACRGFNDIGECDDEYSYFIKIPKDKADKMWSHEIGYLVLAEPPINAHLDVTDYEGATEVISYTVYNNIIPQRELEEIVMFKGVREIDEEIGRLRLEESKRLNESDWEWLGDTKEHANYNGHPQGIVKIYDHDEIDRIVDIIDNYNGFPSTTDRYNLHQGLEDRRDELEGLSEDGEDYGEAVLSVSFFVEKDRDWTADEIIGGFGPNALSLGYWPYEVDERDINDWLDLGFTYNRECELYEDIEQVEQAFKQFQN